MSEKATTDRSDTLANVPREVAATPAVSPGPGIMALTNTSMFYHE